MSSLQAQCQYDCKRGPFVWVIDDIVLVGSPPSADRH